MKLSIVIAVSGLWLLASIPSYADASGLPTGKRQHKPFSVSKPAGKSTANPDRPVITGRVPHPEASKKSKLKKVRASRWQRKKRPGQDRPLIVTLTAEQRAQLSRSSRAVVTIRLTRAQYNAIKKRFPKIKTMKMQVTLSRNKSSANLAAPFIPGGSVVSAAVSGLNSLGAAKAGLSGSTGN